MSHELLCEQKIIKNKEICLDSKVAISPTDCFTKKYVQRR